MSTMEMEIEEEDYVIPAEKLYAVVELVVDKPDGEVECDVCADSCVAASNWLLDVKRIEDGEGHVKYIAGICKWPKIESKLNLYLERRSKPASDWISYTFTKILKFCRSLGQAKEQAEKAISNDFLSESDAGTSKRVPVVPVRLGVNDGNSADDDSDTEPPPVKSLKISHASGNVSRVKSCGNTNKEEMRTSSDGPGNVNSVNFPKAAEADHSSSNGESSKSDNEPHDDSRTISCKKKITFNDESQTTNHKNNNQDGSATKILPSTDNSVGKDTAGNSKAGQDRNHKKTASRPSFTPSRRNSFGRPNSFSPRKLTSTLAPVSNFLFKREIEEIRCSLNALRVTANKIYNCVCPIVETVQDNDDERGMPAIPVDSFENLVLWEKFLQDHDNSIHVVRLLTERCMSSSLRDSVYGMLKFLISNKIACAFNAKGKNKKDAKVKKLSFQETRSCTAMTAALKAYQENMKKIGSPLCYTTNADYVVKTIGLWLKDAPKRYLIDLKSQKEVPDTLAALPEDKYPVPPDDIDLDFLTLPAK